MSHCSNVFICSVDILGFFILTWNHHVFVTDYVKLAEQLFHSLDIQKTGKANKALCDVVVEQLHTALGSSRTDARRILESGYNLGVDGLYIALERVSDGSHFVEERNINCVNIWIGFNVRKSKWFELWNVFYLELERVKLNKVRVKVILCVMNFRASSSWF